MAWGIFSTKSSKKTSEKKYEYINTYESKKFLKSKWETTLKIQVEMDHLTQIFFFMIFYK
jgi:hypothetical protein